MSTAGRRRRTWRRRRRRGKGGEDDEDTDRVPSEERCDEETRRGEREGEPRDVSDL